MYLALATGHGDVDETAGVQDTLVGAALGSLLLLLGLNLYFGMTVRMAILGGGLVDVEAGLQAEGVLALGVAALTLPARAREP